MTVISKKVLVFSLMCFFLLSLLFSSMESVPYSIEEDSHGLTTIPILLIEEEFSKPLSTYVNLELNRKLLKEETFFDTDTSYTYKKKQIFTLDSLGWTVFKVTGFFNPSYVEFCLFGAYRTIEMNCVNYAQSVIDEPYIEMDYCEVSSNFIKIYGKNVGDNEFEDSVDVSVIAEYPQRFSR